MAISLKAARVNANYTQKRAAELIGVNVTTIRNWEKGTSFPSVTMIQKIETVYGVGYNDLIFLPHNNA